jgi:hypothetical protein
LKAYLLDSIELGEVGGTVKAIVHRSILSNDSEKA